MGTLKVKVVRGEELKTNDLVGSSDPFVKLKLAGETRKTNVIKHTNNPEWNQTLYLHVTDPETDSLEIFVYDWDKISRNDLLGAQVVSLKELSPNILQTVTLDLNHVKKHRKNKKNRGRIILELEYQQPSPTDSAEGQDAEPCASQPLSAAEETVLTDSAEAVAETEEEVDVSTSDEDVDEEDAQRLETGAAVVVEDVHEEKPLAEDVESEAENLAEEVPLSNSVQDIPLVVGEDAEAPKPDQELDRGEPIAEEPPPQETSEAIVVEDGDPGDVHEPANDDDNLAEDTPLLHSPEAIVSAVDETVGSPRAHQELHESEAITESAIAPETAGVDAVEAVDYRGCKVEDEQVSEDKKLANEAPLSDSAEAIPSADSEDVEAPNPGQEYEERVTIDEDPASRETGEPGESDVGDGKVSEEQPAEDTPVLDSAKAIPPAEGEDVDCRKPDEGEWKDEEAPSPETAETVVDEAFEDQEYGAGGEQGVSEDEKPAKERSVFDSPRAIRPVEEEDVESRKADQELNEIETRDEEAQSSDTDEAVVVEAFDDRESGAREEKVNEEHLPKEADLLDSAETIPRVESENGEVLNPSQELDEAETVDDEVQSSETGEDIVVEASEERESHVVGEQVNEKELEQEISLSDSAQAVAPVESENVDSPKTDEDSAVDATIVEEVQSPEAGEGDILEAFKDQESDVGDELVNEVQKLAKETSANSAGSITSFDGEDVEAPKSDDELDEVETRNKESREPETGEAVFVEDFEDRASDVGDKLANEEEQLSKNTELLVSADAIPAVESEDAEAPKPNQELDEVETIEQEFESPKTSDAVVVGSFEDRASDVGDKLANEEEQLWKNTDLLVSADAIPAVESEDAEAPKPNQELDEVETIEQEFESPETSDAVVVGSFEDQAPDVGDKLANEEEQLSKYTDLLVSADAIPAVESEDAEAPKPNQELDEVEAIEQEFESPETNDAGVVGSFEDQASDVGDKLANEEEPLSKNTDLLVSADAIPAVESEDAEAPKPNQELDEVEAIEQEFESPETSDAGVVGSFEDRESGFVGEQVNEEQLAEEATLLDSGQAIPPVESQGVTIDEEAHSPETGEAVVVQAFEDREFGVGDEQHNEEQLAKDTLLDSGEAIPSVESEDVEAQKPNRKLDGGEKIDEESQSTETGEGFVVEALEDRAASAVDEQVSEEQLAEETPPLDPAEVIPHGETEDVEVDKPDEKLDESETIDEEAHSPEADESDVVEAFEDLVGDEQVNDEHLVEKTYLLDSAETIPPIESDDVEAPKTDEKLDEAETIDEEAQSRATSEAVVVESFAIRESGDGDEQANVEEKQARETPLLNSAESIPHVESKDVEARKSDEELADGETIDKESQFSETGKGVVVEASENRESVVADELVAKEEQPAKNTPLLDSADAIASVEGEGVESGKPEQELNERKTRDEEPQSRETHETVVVEGHEDRESGIGDEQVHEDEKLTGDEKVNDKENDAKEKPVTDSAEAIPEVEGEDVLSSTSDRMLGEGEKRYEEPKSLETAGAIVVEDVQHGKPDFGDTGVVTEKDNVARETSVPVSTHTAEVSSTAWDVDSESNGTKFPFSICLWCSQSIAKLFGGLQE